ncbi:MAG: hypothetical protein ACK2U9_11165 [Anaerolineae bacterium]
MNAIQSVPLQNVLPEATGASCEHRTVSRDGRIVCRKIVAGDNEVSPNVCRTCPFKAVRCGHLRFSLRQTEPCRLVVRFNGRTEIWDDDPPEVRFEQAACAAKVMPLQHPKQCVGCALRQPVGAGTGHVPSHQPRRAVAGGAAVPFPAKVAAVAG